MADEGPPDTSFQVKGSVWEETGQGAMGRGGERPGAEMRETSGM